MKRKNELKRKMKIIDKFSKAKFNYNKFVKEYYLDNENNAYINIYVNDYYEIISHFSIDKYEWLDQEFADYIIQNAYYIPIEHNIILEICGKKFKDDEKKIIEETIKKFFGVRLADKEQDLKRSHVKSKALLIGGLFSLLFFLIMANIFSSIYLEPLLVIVWFFLWEYFDVSILERKQIKIEKLDAAQLNNMKVIFNEE